MSNIYIQEPPCSGKVCLKTSVGDIDVELWSKECPKACRNFVQLCLEGYYNGTIFHRVVPGFIVQGGDPTGTGMGGDSIYGEPFKDEFHSRLRFVRRGLLAMANAGPNDNGSQFFFTLGPAPELQEKHTIFGKVVGDTLFNMLRLAEGLVDKNEKPLNPHKIIGAEVLNNPFPDIEPRVFKKRGEGRKKKEKSSMKAEKNFNLLSFGDEAEEDEEAVEEINKNIASKGKSAHDLLASVDDKLSSEPAIKTEELHQGTTAGLSEENDNEEKEKTKERIREKLKGKRVKLEEDKESGRIPEEQMDEEEPDLNQLIESQNDEIKKKKVDLLKAEYKQLQKEMVKSRRKNEEKEKVEEPLEIEMTPGRLAYNAEREKYLEIKKIEPKRKTADREGQTLAMLERFKERLDSANQAASSSEGNEIKEDPEKTEEKMEMDLDAEDLEGDDWLAHKFEYQDEELRMAKDANVKTDDTYDIFDPRNPMVKRRREESKRKSKHRKRTRD